MSHESPSRRLTILSADEIEALYSRPTFTEEERDIYFTLAPPEAAFLSQLKTIPSQVYFILQLGYFKARHRFFVFTFSEVATDAAYIQRLYFPSAAVEFTEITKVTRLRQQQMILDLTGYRECHDQERDQLRRKAEQLARIDSQPIYILRELLDYLTYYQILAPAYTWLQEMIGQVLVNEQARLVTILNNDVTSNERTALRSLLTNPDGLYEITQLKRDPRHLGNKEIAREIKRGERMKPLYEIARRVLPHLQISNESINYYASLVHYYSVFQMRQLRSSLMDVYLLCFVHHRYQTYHDHLIITLLYHIKKYQDAARVAAQQAVYERQIAYTKDLQKAGQVLHLLTDEHQFPDDVSLGVMREQAYQIIDHIDLVTVARHLTHQPLIDEIAFRWQHIDTLARSFKLSVRPILRVLNLETATALAPLQEAMQFLKQAFMKRQTLTQIDETAFPTDVIPVHLKKYLYGVSDHKQKYLLVDRYEFLIYRLVREALEAGALFCRHSVRYRRFEEELLSDEHWKQKVVFIQQSNLPILQMDIEQHLIQLQTRLEHRLDTVNKRTVTGENDAIQRKSSRSKRAWHLPQPSLKTAINHPFFNTLPQLDIYDVLHFIQQQCQFMDTFQHILHRNRTTTVEAAALIAALVAWGTNTGIGRMGNISDIPNQHLQMISDNFLRPQTLSEANDRVSDYIASLPIFQHYMIDDRLHSSSDGQKFETAIPTFNARYSPKYFGLKKGVVAYTLVANHIPINARIIGANEHESHYVFDILFNNTTTVQPQIHSTDVHGINHLNFALLHLFGYQFAPRYKDLYQQIQAGLHGFKAPADYPDDFLIRPTRRIHPDYIISEWDNVQRLIISLTLKSTTQHLLISKLHAYPRQHKTRRALEEYDHIVRSLYLLDYIDLLTLRHNVQRALNRGESYHQLRHAVAYANFGKLRFRSEYEQNLWQECSRLLTSCLIAYNATILSDLLLHHQAAGNLQQVYLLQRVSPVAWQHINFYGRYEFNKPPEIVDVPSLVEQLAQFDIAVLEV